MRRDTGLWCACAEVQVEKKSTSTVTNNNLQEESFSGDVDVLI